MMQILVNPPLPHSVGCPSQEPDSVMRETHNQRQRPCVPPPSGSSTTSVRQTPLTTSRDDIHREEQITPSAGQRQLPGTIGPGESQGTHPPPPPPEGPTDLKPDAKTA